MIVINRLNAAKKLGKNLQKNNRKWKGVMEICNRTIKKVRFELLVAGEVFESDRKGTVFTYMRIEDSQRTCNAVDLTDGTLTFFGKEEEVVPLYDAILLRER